MHLYKHNINKYNQYARVKGCGILSTIADQYASPYEWKMVHSGEGLTQVGSGTVSYKHEMEGGEIHNRNGRHHKENKLNKQVKALSIKPLKFKF